MLRVSLLRHSNLQNASKEMGYKMLRSLRLAPVQAVSRSSMTRRVLVESVFENVLEAHPLLTCGLIAIKLVASHIFGIGGPVHLTRRGRCMITSKTDPELVRDWKRTGAMRGTSGTHEKGVRRGRPMTKEAPLGAGARHVACKLIVAVAAARLFLGRSHSAKWAFSNFLNPEG